MCKLCWYGCVRQIDNDRLSAVEELIKANLGRLNLTKEITNTTHCWRRPFKHMQEINKNGYKIMSLL